MMAAPLAGLRVIELTHVWSGPFCGQILADLGAEVIRVENKAALDIHRRGGPYPDRRPGINRSGVWNAQNRGKLGCTLNLKEPAGRDLFLALVARSQVVIENFAPGTLDRLGVGFATLARANPRIILLSLSGFGGDGPDRDSLAYGPMMDAATGLSALTAYDDGVPRAVNGWAADVGGALHGATAILATLLADAAQPIRLDISQFEAGVLFAAAPLMAAAAGEPASPQGRGGLVAAAETAEPDVWIAIAARSLGEIAALADLVGGKGLAATLVRSLMGDGTAAATRMLQPHLDPWAKGLGRAAALDLLAAAAVPAVPINTVPDLLRDPRLARSGVWIETDHGEAGRIRSYAAPIRLAGVAVNERPAPCLGEHNAQVFGDVLGLSADRIAALADAGVI